jgi:hypothetical protein
VEHWICVTCGTRFPASADPPPSCAICLDDRQYVGHDGQRWISARDLAAGHHNVIEQIEPGLLAVWTEPKVAIGQSAHLVRTPHGNVLWDCISHIDDATVEEIAGLGGLSAVAISHPHFFSAMGAWSRAFDAPVLLHADHEPWVLNHDGRIEFWTGETQEIAPGVTLIRCGGHFPGSTVLHWAEGAEGKGELLTADTIMVVADRRWVTFMYSYPNSIPLSASEVRGIVAAIEPFSFARLRSAWPGAVVETDAAAAVRRSAERYIAHLAG